MRTIAEMRKRLVLARLGGDAAATFGLATLDDFDIAAQTEFGRVLIRDWWSAPDRVWHGHTEERAYGLAIAEAGLECHHPAPLRRSLTPTAWECLACGLAVAPVDASDLRHGRAA